MTVFAVYCWLSLLFCVLASAHSMEDRWINSISATVGKDDKSNNTNIYRLGLQNQ